MEKTLLMYFKMIKERTDNTEKVSKQLNSNNILHCNETNFYLTIYAYLIGLHTVIKNFKDTIGGFLNFLETTPVAATGVSMIKKQ